MWVDLLSSVIAICNRYKHSRSPRWEHHRSIEPSVMNEIGFPNASAFRWGLMCFSATRTTTQSHRCSVAPFENNLETLRAPVCAPKTKSRVFPVPLVIEKWTIIFNGPKEHPIMKMKGRCDDASASHVCTVFVYKHINNSLLISYIYASAIEMEWSTA